MTSKDQENLKDALLNDHLLDNGKTKDDDSVLENGNKKK